MRIHTGWLFFATNSVGSKYLQGKAAISGRTKTTGDDVPSRGCSIPCSLTGNRHDFVIKHWRKIGQCKDRVEVKG